MVCRMKFSLSEIKKSGRKIHLGGIEETWAICLGMKLRQNIGGYKKLEFKSSMITALSVGADL